MKPCESLPVVEALRDGRLGPKERESIERHLEVCTECRAHRDSLESLTELGRRAGEVAALTPLEHRRRRLALLRAAAGPRSAEAVSRPHPALRWSLPLAALVLGAAALALVLGSPSGLFAPAGQPLLSRATNNDCVGDITTAVVTSAPVARFDRQLAREGSERVHRVRLTSGTIEVMVQPLKPRQRFLVVTDRGEVEVRGTHFTVTADEGRLTAVDVVEGRVEVRRDDMTRILTAGEAWALAEPTAVAQVEPVAAAEPQASPPTATTSPAPAPPPAPATSVESPEPPSESPSATPSAEAPPSVPAEPDATSQELAAALREMEQGHYEEAGKRLEALSGQHPDHVLAEDADYLRIVALQRAGRHAAAARAARAYLARHPRGARRAEAEAIARRNGK
ncbi:MAG: FecR domain-containing protein [Polyangiaceae bacterium]